LADSLKENIRSLFAEIMLVYLQNHGSNQLISSVQDIRQ